MHPKINFPGDLQPLFDDLARPLHAQPMRNAKREADADTEVSLAEGYRLDAGDFSDAVHIDVVLGDMRAFMSTVMGVEPVDDGYLLTLKRGEVDGGAQAHVIEIHTEGCVITAANLDGARRAVFRLQDHMALRRAPILPLGREQQSARIKTRIIRSPIAPYRWLSGWELDDDNDYYPEEYLRRLAHFGINGLWIPGLLRQLVASKVIPELGPPTHRLDKLNRIIEKAARFGVRIYLFCIEPRALPPDHAASLARPDLLGHKGALCTSAPAVRDYIREAMRCLFTESPDLAGVINIFCGERPTNCGLNDEYHRGCPRCAKREQADIHAETLSTFMEGIRSVNTDAEFMAWTYMMDTLRETRPITPMLEVMKRTDPGVIWLGNFEHGSRKTLRGKEVEIHEYSLSCTGPSPYFVDLAQTARQSGRKIYAKLQVGTSYELSSVPHIPAPGIVRDKFRAAGDLGVTGSMLTWIPGGFPNPMLRMVGEAAFDQQASADALLHRVAAIDWGEQRAPKVAQAWEYFAKAWQQYPFDNGTLYWGPITRGVSYQLHLEKEARLAKPYNWGFNRKREPQPYEDEVTRWLGQYTVDEVIDGFLEMADLWRKGLDILAEPAVAPTENEIELQRQVAVAQAIELQCRAAVNVYRFYTDRDALLTSDAAQQKHLVERMIATAEHDLTLAERMKRLLAIDPTIGYESEIYDFSFSQRLIDEKLLQVTDMLPTLRCWARDGVDEEVLRRTVEEAEWLRPDRLPDRWGD